MSTKTLQPETAKRPLPPGWRWVRLGEVCELNYGEGLPAHLRQEGSVPVYGSNGIVGYHNRSVTQGATIIIGRKGSIGEVHFCNGPCWPIDTTYYVDRTKIESDLEWLTYWLRAMRLPELNKAAAVPGLNRDDAYSLVIPLPPLSEQKRIAGILREQMAAVERARRAAEEQLEAAKALPAAYLRAVFPKVGEPLPPGWRWVRLGEVCEINPPRPTGLNRPDDAPTSFIPMAAVNDIRGEIARLETRPFSQVRKGYTYFAEGDVLFAKITPCMQNGKHAIARGLIDGVGFGTTEFHVLRPTDEVIPEWIHGFIRQRWVLQAAEASFTGSAGQQRVPEEFLANLQIPLPPLSEQKRIAGILREQMASVDRLRQALEEQLEAINKLPAALLHRAFSGEL